MKKVVLASLLACAAIASGLPSAFAQQPVNLGTQPSGQVQMPDAEFAVYNNAVTQTDPKAQAAAYEAYLTQFPQSAVKVAVLGTLLSLYNTLNDIPKDLDTADRLLQVDPSNVTALFAEALIHKATAAALTDPAAMQAGLDTAAGFAQKALAALAGPPPASLTAAQFQTLQTNFTPTLYSVIGAAAMNKKDTATAIGAYTKELAFVPVAQTQAPGGPLQDTYYLAFAYLQSTPPDYLNCAYYFARFTAFAPEPFKSQAAPSAKFCYHKYHGADDDGYADFAAAAQANLNPPAGLFATIKPKPTPADIINGVLTSTPDLSSLAPGDMEFILQNGTADQTQKVWDSVKGKARQFPDVLVVSSTPTQVLVAISEDAVQSKTADFTFNLAPPEDIPEPKPTATPAQKLAYKKAVAAAQKTAADDAAATAPGQTVTLDGTYDSFTPNPTMIIMSGAEVELPKPAAKPAATVHHTPAKKP